MDMTPMTTSTTPKSPDPEAETPIRIQPAKPISFSNGILKRHHHHHPVAVVTYKECLKNHAASLGGHALDGCGEFMPSPSSSPSDPTSLKCAACGCHRNFHRREGDEPSSSPTVIEFQPPHRHHPPPPPPPPLPLSRSPNSSSPPPISSSYMLLALSNNNNSHNNHNIPFSDLGFKNNGIPSSHHHTHNTPGSRKRFRTKFSQYQKERMQEFAERLSWKMQKRDDDMVRDFCRDIGVDRGVLKVWMHNNKNNFTRRDPFSSAAGIGERRSENDGRDTAAVDETDVNGNNSVGGGENGAENRRNEQHNGRGGGFESDSTAHGGNTNGSSSSS